MRGDEGSRSSSPCKDFGSPPRAWGRALQLEIHLGSHRFTPTCVGTRQVASIVYAAMRGSPPRAWGRGLGLRLGRCARRFTPTCVGTRNPLTVLLVIMSVHPHVRGDEAMRFAAKTALPGSPPRAWGRGVEPHGHLSLARFTPTCVGTRRSGGAALYPQAVHPHVRGDEGLRANLAISCIGSPPRAWGRGVASRPWLCDCRFTPTCVGTSFHIEQAFRAAPVHPHVRGDEVIGERRLGECRGSPPRAWGRGVGLLEDRVERRFTPTCVGTRLAVSLRIAISPTEDRRSLQRAAMGCRTTQSDSLVRSRLA